MLPGKMEMAEEEDTKFITDEKFDFGLSSPSDSREEERVEEEEELQHVDRGVAQRLDLNVQQREGVGRSRECLAHWSPLSPEKLEEIVKEANRLAVQLERCSLQEKENASAGALGPAGEPLMPVRLLHKERASPRSPRRETFVVKNSPVRALLPTVEPGTPLPPGKSPSPCARAAPTPPRLRHKLGSCSAGSKRLHKKSIPSKGPALSPTKRPQSSKKPSLQDPPHSHASPAAGRRELMGPRSSPARPHPAQEPSPPLQEASAGRAKASRDDTPQLPASAGPARSAHAHQTQARNTAAPVPTSRRLVPSGIPKPASRSVVLSRAAMSERPRQPQPMGHGSAGRRVLPSAAGQRGPGPQRTAPPGSRLQPPRKVTVPSSLR
ncbi:tripartite motif-containing protein 7-like [Platysternon megacephalum]|uniref:Tripartite motif-containing protein 7-like n=1 Tax=Platysternon megacephalum TaxID=55544 RepID=A0A4D9DWK7_9SAUR|nr:tripartite motif-containing protein 7-like [Platysternon megacephalum]